MRQTPVLQKPRRTSPRPALACLCGFSLYRGQAHRARGREGNREASHLLAPPGKSARTTGKLGLACYSRYSIHNTVSTVCLVMLKLSPNPGQIAAWGLARYSTRRGLQYMYCRSGCYNVPFLPLIPCSRSRTYSGQVSLKVSRPRTE